MLLSYMCFASFRCRPLGAKCLQAGKKEESSPESDVENTPELLEARGSKPCFHEIGSDHMPLGPPPFPPYAGAEMCVCATMYLCMRACMYMILGKYPERRVVVDQAAHLEGSGSWAPAHAFLRGPPLSVLEATHSARAGTLRRGKASCNQRTVSGTTVTRILSSLFTMLEGCWPVSSRD